MNRSTRTTTTNKRRKKQIKSNDDDFIDLTRSDVRDETYEDEDEDEDDQDEYEDEDGDEHEEQDNYAEDLGSSKRQLSARTTTKKIKLTPTSKDIITDDLVTNRIHSETYHQPLDTIVDRGESQVGLLDWFDKSREQRGMPWRKQYDPSSTIEVKGQRAYEIWISEVMLQQTQVTTVIPYWKRWIEKWPTISHLAEADIEQVNSAWTGLGYYRRARGLLAGAKRVQGDFTRYKGRLPDDPGVMEKEIEGIGRYTAGAICSMAYGVTTPIVDGNIHRLLCRLLGLHALPTSPMLVKKLWSVAEMLVENVARQGYQDGVVGDWNQALMEVGNRICKPVAPDCDACPLKSGCRAYAELSGPPPLPPSDEPNCPICCAAPYTANPHNGGIPSVTIFPMKKVAKVSREELTAVCLLKWESGEVDKWLMVKRPEKGLLAGLFEPPSALVSPDSNIDDQIQSTRAIIDNILLPLSDNETLSTPTSCGSFIHVFSHINMTYSVYTLTITGSDAAPTIRPGFAATAVWMTADQVKHANIGTGTKKLWTMVYGPAAFGTGKPSKAVEGKSTSMKRKKTLPIPATTRDGKTIKKIAMPSMPRRG